MHTLEQLSLKIKTDYATLKSWRKTAAPLGINAAMARLIANGYEPGRKIRKRLDLQPTAMVVVVGNGADIPDGTQVIRATQCECGQWFISNHPRRRKCFICSPYRASGQAGD
jgi:hypothetical protein